jgi:hypothetical protein
MRLLFDAEIEHRRCEACDVEWLGPMPCWWCGDLTPPVPVQDEWLQEVWGRAPSR